MSKIISLHEAAQQEYNYQSDIKSGNIIPSTTGFNFLDDRLLGGANDTDIILLSALSGVGKSTLMLRIGYNIATLNKNNRVLYFSFEMPGRKLAAKLIAKDIQKSLKEMYSKSDELVDKQHFDSFTDIPFDIVETPIDVNVIASVCNSYCVKYPTDRCHFIFDHSMIVKNIKGDNSMETLEALSIMCNDTKKIGSRVYWIVSQLNDKIQDFRRLNNPAGQIPRMEDIYGSKTVPHVCNNIVAMVKPSEMNLPVYNRFGPNELPFKMGLPKFRPDLGKTDVIYAVTIKARDGNLGIDPLLDNLKNSELVEFPADSLVLFKQKYNF